MVEGLNTFGSKLYPFPLNSFRQYVATPWGSKSLLAKAGIDPDAETQSWDDFRAKVRTAQQKTGKAGIIMPIKLAGRMDEFVTALVQTAGFPGFGGIETASGAYRYDHDAYVQTLEFLRSFATDKVMLGASTNLDARTGRARWVSGDAVYFFDGPYCAGVCKTDFAKFMPELTVSQMPTQDGAAPTVTSGPSGGDLWISGASKQIDQVSKLLTMFTSDDFRKHQPDYMDAAPLDLGVVPASKANPTYKKLCAWFAKYGFLVAGCRDQGQGRRQGDGQRLGFPGLEARRRLRHHIALPCRARPGRPGRPGQEHRCAALPCWVCLSTS